MLVKLQTFIRMYILQKIANHIVIKLKEASSLKEALAYYNLGIYFNNVCIKFNIYLN